MHSWISIYIWSGYWSYFLNIVGKLLSHIGGLDLSRRVSSTSGIYLTHSVVELKVSVTFHYTAFFCGCNNPCSTSDGKLISVWSLLHQNGQCFNAYRPVLYCQMRIEKQMIPQTAWMVNLVSCVWPTYIS